MQGPFEMKNLIFAGRGPIRIRVPRSHDDRRGLHTRRPGAMTVTAKPKIVSAAEWRQARDELLKAEKEATRTLDAIAAKRRRLPMVKFKNYVFDAPDGPVPLLGLFAGNRELVVYQFMDNGPDEFCPGCTHFTNSIVLLDSLESLGVSWSTVSNMPLAQIEGYKAKMGWTVPFVSSRGTTFAHDCGAD